LRLMMLIHNGSGLFHYWAGKYPGRLGWIVGPNAYKKHRFWPWISYALDNDAFAAWTNGKPWDEGAFFEMLQETKLQPVKPLWVIVPDVVGDLEATKNNWKQYADRIAGFGWPLAFAVQDGMTREDVPTDAAVVFVGGSDDRNWKWRTAHYWCDHFERVHIGRVNSVRRVRYSEKIGAESADGSSWFRDPSRSRLKDLENWLSGQPDDQIEMILEATK